MKRRRKYYYRIHLTGSRIVDGREMWAGMLEAEREVEKKSAALAEKTGRELYAYMVMREPRRRKSQED